MYSAPSASGLLYRIHSPGEVTTACPARTSSAPPSCSTRSIPRSTTVTSSNSGRWPGSTHPSGDTMRATLTPACPEFTRPANSWICFGLLPAAWITVGFWMSVGITTGDGGDGVNGITRRNGATEDERRGAAGAGPSGPAHGSRETPRAARPAAPLRSLHLGDLCDKIVSCGLGYLAD